MPFYPSKVLRARERAPIPFSSAVFCLDSHLSPTRSWERVTRALACPSTPSKCCEPGSVSLTPCSSLLFRFHLKFTFESIKKLRSASHGIRILVEFDSLIREFRWHQRGPVNQYMKPWWKNPPWTEKFHLKLLGRRNKKILKNKKTRRTMMTMKMRSNQPRSFSLQNNWRSYSK